MEVGKTVLEQLKPVGQPGVFEPEQAQGRCIQIADAVIALGGRIVMDVGMVAALCARRGKTAREFLGIRKVGARESGRDPRLAQGRAEIRPARRESEKDGSGKTAHAKRVSRPSAFGEMRFAGHLRYGKRRGKENSTRDDSA